MGQDRSEAPSDTGPTSDRSPSRPGTDRTPDRPPLRTDGAGAGGGDGGDDEIDRRRLIMYVLAAAFAVPLVVEGLTVAGFIGSFLGGPVDVATPTEAGTPTPTPEVVEGADLLAESDRPERVSTVMLRSTDEGWRLTVTVQVENTGDLPYELRLGAVTTDGGRTVEASATTGRVAPGQTGVVSAQWRLPSGDRPDTVAVTAVEFDDGERVVADRTVRVGRVPVRG